MHAPDDVSTFGAFSALLVASLPLVVSLTTPIDASGGQDSLFSEARAYEHFMGRWSRSLAPLFVRFAGVRDGDTVLDVGSGTGALTAAVANVAPSSRIEDREALRLRLRGKLLGPGPDKAIVMHARAWAVRGTIP